MIILPFLIFWGGNSVYQYYFPEKCNQEIDSIQWKRVCANVDVEMFFKEFQKNDSTFYKTEEGHKRLIKAFKDKMTSDTLFAKTCSEEDPFWYRYITYGEELGITTLENRREGELKVFRFHIRIPLSRPLYNGQKYINGTYEIINIIPAEIEDHTCPYSENIDTCFVIDSYYKTTYEEELEQYGNLFLGSYIVGKRKNRLKTLL